MRALLLLCLLPSAIFAAGLQDLVSASNDFEVEMIEHEHVLERNPSATELAASTLKYAKAKERYFVELRKSIPTLVDMATGKTPKTPEVDKIREMFSGYGETQIEAATVSMCRNSAIKMLKSRRLKLNSTGSKRWKTSFTGISTDWTRPSHVINY